MSETRKARRKRLMASQNGRCDPGWGCGLESESLEEVHLRALGMGGDRNDPNDSRNAPGRTILACHECHANVDRVVRAMRKGWMYGLCEWVEPHADNAAEVWREVEKVL